MFPRTSQMHPRKFLPTKNGALISAVLDPSSTYARLSHHRRDHLFHRHDHLLFRLDLARGLGRRHVRHPMKGRGGRGGFGSRCVGCDNPGMGGGGCRPSRIPVDGPAGNSAAPVAASNTARAAERSSAVVALHRFAVPDNRDDSRCRKRRHRLLNTPAAYKPLTRNSWRFHSNLRESKPIQR